MGQEEDEETVEEIVNFVIDQNKSTTNSKFIIRKRKIIHKTDDQETHVEMFEDTFTILSHTKIQNVNETVIMERSIKRLKQKEHVAEIEELQLPTDFMNLETVLPMIDHTESL